MGTNLILLVYFPKVMSQSPTVYLSLTILEPEIHSKAFRLKKATVGDITRS